MSRTGDAPSAMKSRPGAVGKTLDPHGLSLQDGENLGDSTWPILTAAQAPNFGATGTCAVVVAALSLVVSFQAPLRAQTLPSNQVAAACTLSAPPDTLWSLAQCCAKDKASNPSCKESNSRDEYVIVRDDDKSKPQAYLIIPSKKVSGIEDRQIFSEPFLNLWEDGWHWSRQYPGQPAARTGLAINSQPGRDQNQLHIHISCVHADVRKILETKDGDIGFDPAKAITLQLGPHNNDYEVVKVTSLTGHSSPFNVIQAIPGVKDHMTNQSIAVIGSQKTSGEYYVLNTYYHGKDRGEAEELLDQKCG